MVLIEIEVGQISPLFLHSSFSHLFSLNSLYDHPPFLNW